MQVPLVSCLCVTRHAPDLLKKSIDYFAAQTYPNKELIVLYRSNNRAAAEFLSTLKVPHIIPVEVADDDDLTLGERRNMAIEKSKGSYFCNWDDDDWMHTRRIELQVMEVQRTGTKGNVISNILLYDMVSQRTYLSASRAWEGSLLCEKAVVSDVVRYDHAKKGEDAPFVTRLATNGYLSFTEHPYLYVYCHHGDNTWGRSHWENNILKYAMELPETMNELVKNIVSDRYTCLQASILLDEVFEKQR